ncbi:hypothetical protein LZ31DRAFT_187086 [Colletotrichum somersetense]|nr:hypothetical protein LZ31DRAFT_187086 [Colletotrichum somersetense]
MPAWCVVLLDAALSTQAKLYGSETMGIVMRERSIHGYRRGFCLFLFLLKLCRRDPCAEANPRTFIKGPLRSLPIWLHPSPLTLPRRVHSLAL